MNTVASELQAHLPRQAPYGFPDQRAEHEYKVSLGSTHARRRSRDRPAACQQRMNWVESGRDGSAPSRSSASQRTSKNRLRACCTAVEGPGAASTPRQCHLGCSASRVRLALLASSCLAGKNEGNLPAQSMFCRFNAGCPPGVTTATSRPNPSLKRSANGRPPSPGRWYAVHFHRPGLGVLPSSPA
jgi:hypothetical protein